MNKVFSLFLLLCITVGTAQSNINDILAAGLKDAKKYTNAYLDPIFEGLTYSMSGGWYNTADAKPLAGFEISIIGNIVSFKKNKQTFTLNTADYKNLKFTDGSTSKEVSTALGNTKGTDVFIESDINPSLRAEFKLPTGLASENINFIPSAFIQASIGLIKGTEVKVRFLPKIKTDNVAIGLYGIGIQHDFTKHLPADKLLPIAISAVIGYTHLNGTHTFKKTSIVYGKGQKIDLKINTWSFNAVVSTKLPIINFYGGLGYVIGKATTNILGTYTVKAGPFQKTYTNPFVLKTDTNGVTANIGTKLKLGFFRLNVDYTIAEFNNLSFGISFGFR